MKHLVVTGYASVDYGVHLAGPIALDTTIHMRRVRTWPRPGGCPFYIARSAIAAGQNASPVMWVGDDCIGAEICSELRRFGMSDEGIFHVPCARSPASMMVYQPDGRCACLFDPGPAGQEELSERQRDVIAAASHLCVSVGPGNLLGPILAKRQSTTRLYWAVKDDPTCFTGAMRRRLAAEADVIFCSAAERHLIPQTSAVVVETRGSQGICLCMDGNLTEFAAHTVECVDTTGAGDTFAGGFIAAEMAGRNADEAVYAGLLAATKLLHEREGSSP